jgi:hypothetical protein
MKIPTHNGVRKVYGDQNDAHNREYNIGTDHKPMHIVRIKDIVEESKEESESDDGHLNFSKKKMSHDEGKRIKPLEHTKKVSLCQDVHDKLITIAKGMAKEDETVLISSL